MQLSQEDLNALLFHKSIFSSLKLKATIRVRKQPSEFWEVRVFVNKVGVQRRFYTKETALDFFQAVQTVYPHLKTFRWLGAPDQPAF